MGSNPTRVRALFLSISSTHDAQTDRRPRRPGCRRARPLQRQPRARTDLPPRGRGPVRAARRGHRDDMARHQRPAAAALFPDAPNRLQRVVPPDGGLCDGAVAEDFAVVGGGDPPPLGGGRAHRRHPDLLHRRADFPFAALGPARGGTAGADAVPLHAQPDGDGLPLSGAVCLGVAAVPAGVSRASAPADAVRRHELSGDRRLQLHRVHDHDAALPRDHPGRRFG